MKSLFRIRKLLIAHAVGSYTSFAMLLLIAATHGGIDSGPTVIVAAVLAPLSLPIVIWKNLKTGALPSEAMLYVIAAYAIAVIFLLSGKRNRPKKQEPHMTSN